MAHAVPSRADQTVRMRAGREDDRGFITRVASEAFLQYGSYDAYLLDWIVDSHVRTTVAEAEADEGVSVGFYLLAVYAEGGRTVAELLAIAVDREHRNQGVGRALLDDALGAARASHASEVRLSVADGNSRAERLFAAAGFRRTGESGLYPTGQRAVLMVKKLESG